MKGKEDRNDNKIQEIKGNNSINIKDKKSEGF